MSWPDGLPEMRGKLRHVRLKQPGKAYDARELERGPVQRDAAPPAQRASRHASRQTPDRPTGAPEKRLRSRSEINYPEAYRPVEPQFWEGLSSNQQHEVMRLQAVAQEKVGFERGTDKFFIDVEELDPRRVYEPVNLVALATPRLVTGGILIGAGGLLAGLGFSSVLSDIGWAGLGLAGVVAGVISINFGHN